jgi:predicted nucleic acid-binding protein
VRVALDTNRLTDLFRGDAVLGDLLGKCEMVCVPLPVYAEFKAGLLGGSRKHENEALLLEFLSMPSVQLILPSRETAEHYARLFVQLKTAGTPVPINDLWIAALSLEHDLTLVTRDLHFQRIPQLLQIES